MKKLKVEKPWATVDLPEDIWPEILCYLPVKTLLRFRCVSKSLLSLIDSPELALSHLSLFKNNRNGSLLLVADLKKKGVEECVLRHSQTFRKIGKLAFLQSDLDSADTLRYTPVRRKSELWTIQSSFNGLFMLRSRSTWTLMAWNPSIRKTRIVPPSPITSSRGMFTLDVGFGFDPLSKLYKHVVVAVALDTYELQFFAVYTFRTNSWKSIELPIREEGSSKWLSYLLFTGRRVCIRGVIYSLSESMTPTGLLNKLVLFDLSNEVFSTKRFPVKLRHSQLHLQALTMGMGDGQCSLGVVHFAPLDGSVWVLDANSSSESWTQLYTFCIRSLRSNPIHLNVKKAEMLLKRGSWLKSYDLETRKEKTLMQKKDLSKDRIWMYMENLYRFD